MVDVTPSAPERHTEMTDEQKGTVALVQGERTFPTFDAMLEVTVAAAPHRDRESLRRGVFHNAKRLDDGTWTWRYDSIRKGEGFDNLWDDVPKLTVPTTLIRGAHSFFVNDDKGFFHDFSSGKHGDVISFLQETERLSFVEAVQRLAAEAGMTLPAEDPQAAERGQKRQGLTDWMDPGPKW